MCLTHLTIPVTEKMVESNFLLPHHHPPSPSLKEISVSAIVIVKYAVGHDIGTEFCEPEDNRRLEAYIAGLP
jgi:hypothetical protein